MNNKISKFFTPIIFMFFILFFWVFNDFNLIKSNHFSVNFFDMKLWDWIMIKTPENKIILIDGGVWDQMISKISKKMWFFERRIDYVFLTHWDADHISWLISIMKKFEIWKIFLTKKEKNTYLFKEFIKILDDKSIEYDFFSDLKNFSNEKNIFLDKSLFLKPIFPIWDDFEKMKKSKNFSLVFELIFKNSKWENKKFLFTWDIQKDIEEYLLNNNRIWKVDYLKIAHHWSKTSSVYDFILKSNPDIWIIVAWKNNRFWHPHEEVVSRFEKLWVKILHTGKSWDVELKVF